MTTHPYSRIFTGKTSAPTVVSDTNAGYEVGDLWLDQTNKNTYQALDVTISGAVWKQLDNFGRTLISEQSPSGTTVATWSTIPGTYKELVLKGYGRSVATASAVDYYLEFNGDTTATNYISLMNGAHPTNTALVQTYLDRNLGGTFLPAANAPANSYSMIEVYIPQYANSGFLHIAHWSISMYYNTGDFYSAKGSLLWKSTTAISQIDLRSSSGNYAANSVFRLYGEN